jgi:cytoskeletal protein RodZ
MLQAARLASGLSIEELSKKTLVRSGILKDLENYDCASCGGIAYARGHLRNIAKVLKIDSKELIADFETKINLETRPIFDRLADNNVTQKIAQKSGLSFKSIGFGVATVAILGGVVFLAMQNSGTAVVQKTSPTTSAQSVSTISNGIDLTFVGVYGKSWIGITDKDENVVFDGILYQGETKKFTNPTELKVIIGNGAAVSYVLNGQDKGVAGKLGEVVHLDLKVGA